MCQQLGLVGGGGVKKWHFPVPAFRRLRSTDHQFLQLNLAVTSSTVQESRMLTAQQSMPVEAVNNHVYYFTRVKLEVLALPFDHSSIV